MKVAMVNMLLMLMVTVLPLSFGGRAAYFPIYKNIFLLVHSKGEQCR